MRKEFTPYRILLVLQHGRRFTVLLNDLLTQRTLKLSLIGHFQVPKIVILRWLDWIFLGGYLPSLSINYVAMSKDMGKRLPQLYYIKMKISYDLGFIAIGVAMAT